MKPVLAPGLEHGDGHGIGQVQAALIRPHGQAQPVPGVDGLPHVLGQAAGFGAKHQPVAGLPGDVVHASLAARGQGEQPLRRGAGLLQKGNPVGVAAHVGVLVVVQPGAPHQLVVHGKAQRLDQVQRAAGVRAQADHVARVRRDFGVDEDDVEHGGRRMIVAASIHPFAGCWRAREDQGVHPGGARGPQGLGSGGQGGAGGGHVVHQQHPGVAQPRQALDGRGERAPQVAQALLAGQPVLGGAVTQAGQDVRPQGAWMQPGDRLGEFPGRVMAAFGQASRRQRHGGDPVGAVEQGDGTRRVEHQLGEGLRPARLSLELEAGDQPVPGVGVVHPHRAGGERGLHGLRQAGAGRRAIEGRGAVRAARAHRGEALAAGGAQRSGWPLTTHPALTGPRQALAPRAESPHAGSIY